MTGKPIFITLRGKYVTKNGNRLNYLTKYNNHWAGNSNKLYMRNKLGNRASGLFNKALINKYLTVYPRGFNTGSF